MVVSLILQNVELELEWLWRKSPNWLERDERKGRREEGKKRGRRRDEGSENNVRDWEPAFGRPFIERREKCCTFYVVQNDSC